MATNTWNMQRLFYGLVFQADPNSNSKENNIFIYSKFFFFFFVVVKFCTYKSDHYITLFTHHINIGFC